MLTSTASRVVTVRRSWPETLAAAWSAAAAGLGGFWVAFPGRYPRTLRDPEAHGSLVALLDQTLVAGLLVGLGAIGLVAALRARDSKDSRTLAGIGLGYAVVFGLLATDMSLLVAMGYSVAILGPPVLFAFLVAASVHRPSLRWAVVGVVAAAALTAAVVGLGTDDVATFGRELALGLGRSGTGMLLVLLSFLGGVVWLMVGLRAVGFRRAERPVEPSYTRPSRDWGWWVTVLAAVGPLPYALLRMTWLTPWPFWMSDAQLDAHPETRLFGLSLGFAAIAGSVLTIGLLARWGSVYPRWVPWLGGRAVPPTWPTVLAVVVGVAITVAGRSMIQLALQGSILPLAAVETLLILPFWGWGPLLVSAAVAYYRRRTAAATVALPR